MLNFLVGGCGIGKTYGVKKHCLQQFEKKEEQFIFIRRNKTEYLKKVANFFAPYTDDEDAHFKKDWSVSKDGTFLCKGKVGGYYASLSELMAKGDEYPGVANIFFDEFIVHGGYQRYLPDEFNCFLGAIDSICRYKREVHAYLCANAVSLYNPYFLELGYQYNGKEFWAPKSKDNTGLANDSLVEWCENGELAHKLSQTRFGRLIKGTKYGDYSLYNKSLRENEDFIKKKTAYCKLLAIFLVNGIEYGIWRDINTGYFYWSNSKGNGCNERYSITDLDKQVGYLSIRALRNTALWMMFVRAFDFGQVYFDDALCKAACFETLRKGWGA